MLLYNITESIPCCCITLINYGKLRRRINPSWASTAADSRGTIGAITARHEHGVGPSGATAPVGPLRQWGHCTSDATAPVDHCSSGATAPVGPLHQCNSGAAAPARFHLGDKVFQKILYAVHRMCRE